MSPSVISPTPNYQSCIGSSIIGLPFPPPPGYPLFTAHVRNILHGANGPDDFRTKRETEGIDNEDTLLCLGCHSLFENLYLHWVKRDL